MKRRILIIFCVLGLFQSCLEDNNMTLILPEIKVSKLDENGLTPAINDFISDSLLNIIIDLGMEVNTGENPPDLNGKYFISPLLLQSTNIIDDYPIGYQFNDLTIEFYNQNNDSLTIMVRETTVNHTGNGVGGFVVGEGELFTIFANMELNSSGYICNPAIIISGALTTSGIENLQYCILMVDDHGDPGNIYIEIGESRVAYDSDYISPKIEDKSFIISNNTFNNTIFTNQYNTQKDEKE